MRDLDNFLEKCPKLKAMVESQKSKKQAEIDKVRQLAEGLSTATTIDQIRAVAQSILDETEGTE